MKPISVIRKTHPAGCIILLCLYGVAPACARQDDPATYFPLKQGNHWTFFEVLLPPPDFVPDTLFSGPFQVSDSLFLNDMRHYVFHLPFTLADTVRVDEDGRVWAWQGGADHLLYDFTLPDGATYTFPWNGVTFEVGVAREVTAETAVGAFNRGIRFRFDIPGALDAAHTFTFAPGVGPVEIIGSMGEYLRLFEARVNDATVTDVDRAPEGDTAFSVFPNPFHETLHVRVELDRPTPVSVAVYDPLGRRVASPVDGVFATGRFEAVWAAGNRPGGVYLVRIRAGERVWTGPVTLVR